MGRVRHLAAAMALAGLIAACGSSAGSTVGPVTVTSATPGGAATSSSGSTPGEGGGVSTPQATKLPDNAAYPADPCTLLTTDQVKSVTGLAVADGDSGGDTHSCGWVASNGQVLVTDNEDAGQCDVPSSSALGITVTKISGLGDKACITSMTGLGTILNLYQGSLGFSVSVTGEGVPDSSVQNVEKQLATDLLGDL